MKKYLIVALIAFFTLGIATLAAAQDTPRKEQGQSTERQKDTNVDIQIQGRTGDDGQRATQGPEGRPGPEGPAGTLGPQGAPGPSGSSSGTVLGMDPTLALLVGLGVLAVVIVAIVAASRGREA